MYIILDNEKVLTREEIKANYDGKWVFLTNCEFTAGSKLIRGVPRVVADKQAEGVGEGVYDSCKDSTLFGETYGLNLIHFDYFVCRHKKHFGFSA